MDSQGLTPESLPEFGELISQEDPASFDSGCQDLYSSVESLSGTEDKPIPETSTHYGTDIYNQDSCFYQRTQPDLCTETRKKRSESGTEILETPKRQKLHTVAVIQERAYQGSCYQDNSEEEFKDVKEGEKSSISALSKYTPKSKCNSSQETPKQSTNHTSTNGISMSTDGISTLTDGISMSTDGNATSTDGNSSRLPASPSFPKLYKGIIPIPGFPDFNPKPGSYAAAIFDHNGGHLKLPEKGVKLFIPPMAIPEGQEQPVYIYMSDDFKHKPQLGEDKERSTVFCGPNGLCFEGDVYLTIPHNGTTQSHGKFIVQRTDTEINEVSKFEASPDMITFVNKTDHSVTIVTNHFTGFEITNDKENQNVKQGTHVLTVPYFQRKGEDVVIRVYACPREELKRVEKEERQLGGTKADVSKWLTLTAKDDINIVLKIQDEEHHHNKRMDCEKLLQGMRMAETFTVRHNISHQFRCRVKVKQSEEVEFDITEPAGHGQKQAIVSTCMPYSLEREICLHLDATDHLNVRQRFFSDVLGLDQNEINKFMNNESPAKVLLEIWQTRQGQIGRDQYISLLKIFMKYERIDVCGILERYVEKHYGFPIEHEELEVTDEEKIHGVLQDDSGYLGTPASLSKPSLLDSGYFGTPASL